MIIFIILGFVSSIFQLVLAREFTFSIAKNELALIAGLGVWLLCCSAAALVGARKKIVSSAGLAVLFSLAFGISVCLAHMLKISFAIPYYEIISIVCVLLSACVVLGPTGALSGLAFAQLSRDHLAGSDEDRTTVGRLFAYEAFGVLLGGGAFTFIFSSYDNPLSFATLPLLFVPVLKIPPKGKFAVLVMLMGLSIVFTNHFPILQKKEFQGADIVWAQGSPCGPLILTDDQRVRALYLNGSLIATSEDKEAHETFIHTALSARAKIQNVLWIGPCLTSQAQELEKYPAMNVTNVDINPRPASLPSFYAPGKNIIYYHQDPRSFMAKDKGRYDFIILNIPAPTTLLFNRFFTVEFFNEAKSRLSDNGILAFSIPSKADILSPAIQAFDACLIHSLKRVFPFVFLVPGDAMIVMGSSAPIDAKTVIENFERNKPSTQFFTVFHLRDMLDSAKQKYIEQKLQAPAGINQDLVPYGFLYALLMEQAKFTPRMNIDVDGSKPVIFSVSLLIIGILAFLVLLHKPLWAGFQAGVIGFLAMATSTVIYFIFQVLCGGLFWKLGILVGLFMAGLGLSSFLLGQAVKRFAVTPRHVGWLFVLWFVFCAEMFFWANYRGYTIWHQVAWMVLSFESGLLTGMGYPLLSAAWNGKRSKTPSDIASLLYSADLVGAFLGTLFCSVLFIPFLGVNISCLIFFGVIAVLGIKDLFC